MNRVVHFEIPASDPDRVMKFYQSVFGWKFNRFGEAEYWIVETGPAAQPGINGAIMKRRDANQPVANSIEVENIDRAVESVAKNGGQIVVPKTTIPAVGYFAFFKDPDENIFGLWHNDAKAK